MYMNSMAVTCSLENRSGALGKKKKKKKIGRLETKIPGVWEYMCDVYRCAPCLKILTHVNTFQRAATIEETLKNQAEKLAKRLNISQHCYHPPLNCHNGSVNRVAPAEEMKIIHELALTDASEGLAYSNTAWKYTCNMALFLEETDRPLGDKTIILERYESHVCYASGCICFIRIMASISLPLSKSHESLPLENSNQGPTKGGIAENVVATFSSVM